MRHTDLLPALATFDARVVEHLPHLPDAEIGDRVSCHPVITTEADFQRWFGDAMEQSLPTHRVHAEVHAVGSASGHASRVGLTVHVRRATPFLWNRDVVVTDVRLCVELKVLPVGAHDRAWLREETVAAALDRLVTLLRVDLTKRACGDYDVVSVVFLEPLAYGRPAEERTRIAARIHDALAHAGWSVHLPTRADGSPMCIALVTRTPVPLETDR